MKAAFCPNCGHTGIHPYVGFQTGFLYFCDNCNYVGPIIVHVEQEVSETMLKDPVFATDDFDFTLTDIMIMKILESGKKDRDIIFNLLFLPERFLSVIDNSLSGLEDFKHITKKDNVFSLTKQGKDQLKDLEKSYDIKELSLEGPPVTNKTICQLLNIETDEFTVADVCDVTELDTEAAQLLLSHLKLLSLVEEIEPIGTFRFHSDFKNKYCAVEGKKKK